MDRPESTRDRLIAAAVALIDEGGITSLRLRKVAERVGIQEPSIYGFFSNRDDLIDEASAARFQRGLLDLPAVFSALMTAATTREEFRAAVATVLTATVPEERATFRSARIAVLALARTRPDLSTRILRAQQEADELLGAVIREAAARGWARSDVDPAILARWIIGLVNARVFLELDPQREGAADWDRLTSGAVLSMMEGPATDVGGPSAGS